MIKALYFLLLLMASAEDVRTHTVRPYKVILLWVLGIFNMIVTKENRWVTFALTCLCFGILVLVYHLVCRVAERKGKDICFGGADVRLIPAMMLVQGWDVALTGVFLGFVCVTFYYVLPGKREKEIPLIPWMSVGCFLAEIFYLFS